MDNPITPWKAGLVVLTYALLCAAFLCFSAPDYAASVPHAASTGVSDEGDPRLAAYDRAGPYAVTTQELRWTDTTRNRVVPIRVLRPEHLDHFAVILFSHGLGGSLDSGSTWVRHWASHGFMVISIDHVGSDDSIWRDKPLGERLSSLRTAGNPAELVERDRDVKFVLDELSRFANDPLFRGADLTRIGLSGHSYGAQTTELVAGQLAPHAVALTAKPLVDDRIRAAIALSPSATDPEHLDEQFAPIHIPFFSITGTIDGHPFPGIGVEPANRVLPFAHMTPGDKYLLVIDGADHMLFNGAPGLRDFRLSADRRRSAAIEPHAYALVKASTLAFWQAYLNDDGGARRWLQNRSLVPVLAELDRFEVR